MFIRSEEIGSFKREKFNFTSIDAVNHYWSELQNVATSTPLNRRIYDTSGEELEEKDEYRGDKSKHGEVIRKDWFESHISRSTNDPDDSGLPPGDGRGAGGIDSWLFTHLERNWLRKVTKTTEKVNMLKQSDRKRPAEVTKVKRIESVTDRSDWMRDSDGMIYRKIKKSTLKQTNQVILKVVIKTKSK